MIALFLNGQPKKVAIGSTLAQAIAVWEYTESNFAAAVNQQFVPRSHYHKTVLNDGDHIDVIAPMQGG